MNEPKRIFILGAGFSKPAGLPLANEFYSIILHEAKRQGLYAKLEKDLEYFIRYYELVYKRKMNDSDFLEEFISYLDIEHYLLLRGSKTWSIEGNESQLIIRNIISKYIFEKQSLVSFSQMKLYEDLVSNLNKNDILITFNYDTILETALRHKGIPYRYTINKPAIDDIIDNSEDNDIILLKVHGSINWFDINHFNDSLQFHLDSPSFMLPRHPIFSSSGVGKYFPKRIYYDFSDTQSQLKRIYSVDNIGEYFNNCDYLSCAPLIITPSLSKLIYLNPLRELWSGFNNAGKENKDLIIIGYSFSHHDEYTMVPIFTAINNFQNHNILNEFGYKQNDLKIIDLLESNDKVKKFKDRLPFIDWKKSRLYTMGFGSEMLEHIFE